MKRNRQLVPSGNTSTRFSCQQKRTRTTIAAADFYLPDNCWEHVFKFLNNGDDDRYLESLSVVSKQFLSITNCLLFSLKVYSGTRPFLGHLLRRFTNLTSVNLKRYKYSDINVRLHQISCFPLNLSSLNLSCQPTIPAGLRTFSQNITTLTSLTCSKMNSINSNDLFLIAECFPLLEELDLSYPKKVKNRRKSLNGVETLSLTLFKLTKINLSGHDYINDTLLFNLFKNCKLLEKVIMFRCSFITKAGIASALFERPTLRSLSFTNYSEHCITATLFELVRNYPSLSEIGMKYFNLLENSTENSYSSMDFVVRPQLKSLCLACSGYLRDKNIEMFASIFPNLQRLDLSECYNISEEGIFHILRRCGNIRHLNLSNCGGVKLIGLNFEVPKLEVLNLSYTIVDDETLYVISKNCGRLLQLLLKCCPYITKKGVMHVIENCTQLREINLRHCHQVRANSVDDMVFSRPSLRKITAPPGFVLSNRKRELFSCYGCLVC